MDNHNMPNTATDYAVPTLEGSRALAEAFNARPLSSTARSGADVCVWNVDIEAYQHVEVPEMLIGLLTAGDVKWRARRDRGMGCCVHGRVTIIPAGAEVNFEPDGPLAATTLHIGAGRIEEAFEVDDGQALFEEVGLNIGFEEPLMAAALFALTGEINNPSERGTLFADSLIDTLLHKTFRCVVPSSPIIKRGGLAPLPLRRVTEFIDAELASELSLRRLAVVAGVSEHHFCRSFKMSTGMTPHQFVVDARVQRAKRLLRANRASIGEIAHEVGFSSHAHLCDAFRKVTGLTPKSFRRSSN